MPNPAREEAVPGRVVGRLTSCQVRHRNAKRREPIRGSRRSKENFTFVRLSLFVNALTSVVVTEQVPINTNLSLRGTEEMEHRDEQKDQA